MSGKGPDELTLGKNLQVARLAACLTQQELCQKANLSYSTLAKIERGAIRAPSIFTIQAIAGVLALSLDELVGSSLTNPNSSRQLISSRSGIRFVYFDVNGCLVRFYQRAFSLIAEATGVPSDVVEMACWHFNDQANRGVITLDGFNQAVATRIGLKTFNWADYYLSSAEAVPGMNELLSWTLAKYKTGLLTNIMPGLLKALQDCKKVPFLPYDAIIDSSQIGTVKPESQIYEIAEKEANTSPQGILLIDDTPANLRAAELRGWHVIWFDYARPEESIANIKEALQPTET